jgi:hypothetical protein
MPGKCRPRPLCPRTNPGMGTFSRRAQRNTRKEAQQYVCLCDLRLREQFLPGGQPSAGESVRVRLRRILNSPQEIESGLDRVALPSQNFVFVAGIFSKNDFELLCHKEGVFLLSPPVPPKPWRRRMSYGSFSRTLSLLGRCGTPIQLFRSYCQGRRMDYNERSSPSPRLPASRGEGIGRLPRSSVQMRPSFGLGHWSFFG